MWSVVRRLSAVFGWVASAVGFTICAAAAVGVWWVKAETNRRTDAVAVRAHAAVNAAGRAVGFVRGVIHQADRDLADARKTGPVADPVNPFVQLTARRASENLAGSVERANGAVVTASEAAVVAKAALELFDDNDELKGLFGVKPEQLVQTQADLDAASRELRNVRTLLGIPVGGAQPTAEQLVTVESALNQARGFTDQMGNVVTTARTRVDETKRAVDMWALRAALVVTLVGALGAAGQFFTARFCWRTLRGKPA